MRKGNKRFVDFLRYGGVTKNDFDRVRFLVAEENHMVWRFASTILAGIFLIAFVICASIPVLKNYLPGYVGLVAYFMVIAILLFTVIKPNSKALKPLIYISSTVLIAIVLYQGFFAGEQRSIASYCAIVVAVSVLSVDRPFRYSLLIFISTIAFIILMCVTSLNQLYPDLYAGIIFGIIGIFITMYVNHIRIKDIVLRYNAEQERDIDSLTGVKNKNAYDRMVNSLMNSARSADLHFALVIFDVNGLKMTNDTYGHEYGDQLLIRASQLISQMFPNCFIYRIGGDEFATFVTGDNYDKRNAIIGEFKKHISALHDESIVLKDDTSIACGLATYDAELDRDYVSLFSRADANMYENKHEIKSTNKFLIN